MLKVLGGEWRGRTLRTAPDPRTRPSSSRLREALFSVLGPLTGPVADLFAGSGSLGIEALSRGATHVTFVELDPRAVRTIRTNLETLDIPRDRWVVRRGDARRWLARLRETTDPPVETILADPPYVEDIAAQFLPTAARLIHSGRIRRFVLEHPAVAELPLLTETDLQVRTREIGSSAFTCLETATP